MLSNMDLRPAESTTISFQQQTLSYTYFVGLEAPSTQFKKTYNQKLTRNYSTGDVQCFMQQLFLFSISLERFLDDLQISERLH